jgi:urea transport system permease protein
MAWRLVLRFVLMTLVFSTFSANADEASVRAAISKFAEGNGYASIESAIDALGATGDPLATNSLNALNDGLLVLRKDDGQIFITDAAGAKLIDPVTGETVGDAAGATLEKLKIKNSIRRKIAMALSGMTLLAKDRKVRLEAANTIFASADATQLSHRSKRQLRAKRMQA